MDLLWASPECTNHSIAKGDLHIDDQSRSTAMAVLDALADLRPPVMYCENVTGFLRWAPLERRVAADGSVKMRPIRGREGELFRAWANMIAAQGYAIEWRKLVAADYGDPTSRERLIIQATLPHVRMDWPTPMRGPPGSPLVARGDLRPWRTAASIIENRLYGIPYAASSQGCAEAASQAQQAR